MKLAGVSAREELGLLALYPEEMTLDGRAGSWENDMSMGGGEADTLSRGCVSDCDCEYDGSCSRASCSFSSLSRSSTRGGDRGVSGGGGDASTLYDDLRVGFRGPPGVIDGRCRTAVLGRRDDRLPLAVGDDGPGDCIVVVSDDGEMKREDKRLPRTHTRGIALIAELDLSANSV